MKKIKETYLLFLIVIGLISLSLYSTYALFTASTTINDVVGLETTLATDSNIIEYEMVTVAPGENKIIEVKVKNNYGSTLYYGVWYEMLKPLNSSNVDIGLYTKQDNTPSSGQIPTNTELTLLVGISNNGTENAMVNIGTIGSLTPNLNLTANKKLIPVGWYDAILVSSEYLDDHSTTTSGTVTLDFTYTGAVQTATIGPGQYQLQVWGAQGGNYSTNWQGGKGGYSYGTLNLTASTKVFVYVGQQNNTYNTSTSQAPQTAFNGGGGATYCENTYSTSALAGGGGTDIRIGTDSLYARVIVAGGGGGSTSHGPATEAYGGGTTSGSDKSTSKATQTQGGMTGSGTRAAFGQGATGTATSWDYVSGGGGGGWYGGGGNYWCDNDDDEFCVYNSGGGSGYVYTSSTYSNYPSGCLLNSSYYLTNAATVAGNTSFTDFDGSTVTGHSGNGAARIVGPGQITVYTIPTISGLTELSVARGTTVNLTTGVSVTCEQGATGCSLVETSITDTATLGAGTHTIYYVVKSASNVYYKYPRTIVVSDYENSWCNANGWIEYSIYNASTGTTSNSVSNEACRAADHSCGDWSGCYSDNVQYRTCYYYEGGINKSYEDNGDCDYDEEDDNGNSGPQEWYDANSFYTNYSSCEEAGYDGGGECNPINPDNWYAPGMTYSCSCCYATHPWNGAGSCVG